MGDHTDALRNFNDDYLVGYEQRELASEDMEFMTAPGGHWAGWLRNYSNARPKLQYDHLNDFLNRFMGNWELNPIGIDYRVEDGADEELAELLTGIYRRDYRRNNGKLAVSNGVQEASIAGVGGFEISTEFADEEKADAEEQIIRFDPIHSAHNRMVFDAAAQRADKGDAQRVTILTEFTKESYERAYPDRELPSGIYPDNGNRHNFRWAYKDLFYVGRQFTSHVDRVMAEVWINPKTQQHDVFFPDELKADGMTPRDLTKSGWVKVRERKVVRRKVERSVIDGSGFIEEPRVIAGKYLPVIPIYCNRSYVDGIESYRGLIRDKKDPQRVLNLQMSRLTETAAGANRRIPIMDQEEVDGFETLWAGDLSQKNYIVKNTLKNKNGDFFKQPTEYLEPPGIDPSTGAIIDVTRDYLRDRTGGAIQDVEDPDLSGKAIRELRTLNDMNTHFFTANIKSSMIRAGMVYREMAGEVYASSRQIKVVGHDDSERTVQLMEPRPDPETGKIKFANDLSKGRFEVIASAGPSYQTQQQQAADEIKDVLAGLDPADPMRPILSMVLVNMLEVPGLKDFKAYVRRQLLAQGVVNPENKEEEEYLQGLQEQQSQGNPQQDAMIQAATVQMQSEAQENAASAFQKQATGQLNLAKIKEIEAKINELPADARAARIEKLKRASDNEVTNRLKLIQGERRAAS